MPDLEEVTGLSEARAEKFREAGYTTVDKIAKADPTDLADIKGIGESTGEDIRDSARDVLRDTVPDEDDSDEEEVNTEPPEPDVDTSVPDVEDTPDEFEVAAKSGEVEATDEDEADAESEDEGPPYELTIALDSDEQYDYLHYSLMNIRHGQAIASATKKEKCEEILEEIRTLGGAGEVTIESDLDGLNGLHSSLVQTRSNYQGVNADAYRTLDAIIAQVNDVREEHL